MTSTGLEAMMEKATKGPTEDWGVTMDIVDVVLQTKDGPRQILALGMKKLSGDRKGALLSLSVIEACVKNCTREFHVALATSNFIDEMVRLLQTRANTAPEVCLKMKELIAEWAHELGNDKDLQNLKRVYQNLKNDGFEFANTGRNAGWGKGSASSTSKSAHGVSEEDADMALALKLSLREAEEDQKKRRNSKSKMKDILKVKAIHNFDAQEKGELGFTQGDVITVLDDSDDNWWKGQLNGWQGLFPESYVQVVSGKRSTDRRRSKSKMKATKQHESDESKSKMKATKQHESDEHVKSSSMEVNEAEKSTSSNAKETDANTVSASPVPIDPTVINRLLDMIASADPTEELNAEAMRLKTICDSMRPVVTAKLAEIDSASLELLQLNDEFVAAFNDYDRLMRGMPLSYTGPAHQQQYMHAPQQHVMNQPGVQGGEHSHLYNSNFPQGPPPVQQSNSTYMQETPLPMTQYSIVQTQGYMPPSPQQQHQQLPQQQGLPLQHMPVGPHPMMQQQQQMPIMAQQQPGTAIIPGPTLLEY